MWIRKYLVCLRPGCEAFGTFQKVGRRQKHCRNPLCDGSAIQVVRRVNWLTLLAILLISAGITWIEQSPQKGNWLMGADQTIAAFRHALQKGHPASAIPSIQGAVTVSPRETATFQQAPASTETEYMSAASVLQTSEPAQPGFWVQNNRKQRISYPVGLWDDQFGTRWMFTSRQFFFPGVLPDQKLSRAEIKKVESEWVELIITLPAGYSAVIYAGGLRQSGVEYNNGVLLLLYGEGSYTFGIRNGELAIWYPGQDAFRLADLRRIELSMRQVVRQSAKGKDFFAINDAINAYLGADLSFLPRVKTVSVFQ